jgi:guanylate kinase
MQKQSNNPVWPIEAVGSQDRGSALAGDGRTRARWPAEPSVRAPRAQEERSMAVIASSDWERLPGRLCVVSGPSGVGKSTLAKRLIEQPGLKAQLSVSATTRPPRPGERPGIDYHFVSSAEFERMRTHGALLEWAEVHGHFYGTPIEPLGSAIADGYCVLLIIDVQGGLQVKQEVPGALLVFIDPPNLEILEARLRARSTDDESTIRRRLENARREIELANAYYPIHVINENLDEAVTQLVDYLKQHGCGG